MSGNGNSSGAAGHTLEWPRRVLAFDDLRRSLNGHTEVILSRRTVVTPLADEFLRNNGIQLTRHEEPKAVPMAAHLGFAQDRAYPQVSSAIQALQREGQPLRSLPADGHSADRWSRAVAECIGRGDCQGGVIFCGDPGLTCCVANKLPGLRAVAVVSIAQAARATLGLGANLLAVEMPGRTFFEIRQILRTLLTATICPPGVACTLRELDGHAHR